MNVKFNFKSGDLEKTIQKSMEQKIRECLSGSQFSGLKVEFDWKKSEPLKLSGPEDQLAAAKKMLEKTFGK